MTSAPSHQRYTAVAIVLHWAIAIAIVGQIALGWWMGDAIEEVEHQAQAAAAFQLHKSIGLTVLALSVLRLGWRLTHKPPALPAHMPGWEKLGARLSHWGFYILMIGLPLTGWLYVSTGWSAPMDRPLNVPTLYFGLFDVPHIPGLAELGDGARSAASAVLEFIHSKMAWVAIALLVLHVGAALKHHFYDQDDVLTHMVPGLKPLSGEIVTPTPVRGRGAVLIAGFALIVLAIGAASYAFLNPPGAAAPVAAVETEQNTEATLAQPEAPALTSETAPEAAPIPQAPPEPSAWRVNRDASSIRFTGSHSGTPFEGSFSRWRADIRFDPNNLDASSARVTIETASASDGIALHDATLPQEEWFDTANHPTATFRTTRIRARGNDQYEARGILRIKDNDIDLDLPFTLVVNGGRAIMDGRADIRRDEADLGQQSDPGAEWVSREIGIVVHVEATRVP